MIDDIDSIVGCGFVNEYENVVLVGWQREELGGSEFLKTIRGRVTGKAPHIEIDEEVRLQRVVLQSIRKGIASCAHDCAEGGLLVALAEMCFSNDIGVSVSITTAHSAGHLFGEAQSRVILSVSDAQLPALQTLCDNESVPMLTLGKTGGNEFRVANLVDVSVSDLLESYESALPSIMATSLH